MTPEVTGSPFPRGMLCWVSGSVVEGGGDRWGRGLVGSLLDSQRRVELSQMKVLKDRFGKKREKIL